MRNMPKIDLHKLEKYRSDLVKKRNQLLGNAEELRQRFIGCDWDDNLSEIIKENALNKHFDSVNVLISVLDQAITQLDAQIALLRSYVDFSERH